LLIAAIFFLPIWRDRENAWYVIEPMRTETLHAAIPGKVIEVFAQQGETVRAGQPLLRMSSTDAASMHSAASAEASTASFRAFSAEIQGESIGAAAAGQTAATRSIALAREAQSSLDIVAPADATVFTRNPAALLGQQVASGQTLLELGDAGPRIVRIYVPVSALERVRPGAEAALHLPDRFSIVRVPLLPLGGDAVTLPPGLVATQVYKGIKLPVFYSARMTLPTSAGSPLFGVSGQAKIFGERRSFAERVSSTVINLIKAHLW